MRTVHIHRPLPHRIYEWQNVMRGEIIVRRTALVLAGGLHPAPTTHPVGTALVSSGRPRRYRGDWIVAEWFGDRFVRLVRPDYLAFVPRQCTGPIDSRTGASSLVPVRAPSERTTAS